MDDGTIGRTRAEFVAALRNGDAAAASALYAYDAKLIAPSAELLRGRIAIEAFWRAGLEAGVCNAELESLELGIEQGLAYEIGRYALTLEPADGASVVDRGAYLLVHQRQADGSWLWAAEMFNPDAPPVGSGGRPERGRSSHVEAQTGS